MSVLSGSLFSCRDWMPLWSRPGIVTQTSLGVVGWSELVLHSSKPLLLDELGYGPFRYVYRLRESGQHFLLVGEQRDLVPHLLVALGAGARVSTPTVDVPRLAAHVTLHPGAYALGALYARVDGYGHSFRTVVFYGHDLAEAKLFSDLLPQFLPFRALLRDISENMEVLSISSRGGVSFRYSDEKSLRAVDRCLRYLSDRNLLSWESTDERTNSESPSKP